MSNKKCRLQAKTNTKQTLNSYYKQNLCRKIKFVFIKCPASFPSTKDDTEENLQSFPNSVKGWGKLPPLREDNKTEL